VIDLAEHRVFWGRALRRPARLGAPAPTGPVLADRVGAAVPRTGRPTVVELGAGTGALSRAIRARMPPGGRFVAVEVDPHLVDHLHRVQPGLEVLAGDAAALGPLLGAAGVGPVDLVVSSLPWTLLAAPRRRSILAGIAATMAPTGTFLTISTLTALPSRARAVRTDLAGAFWRVRETPPVWRNVPPSRLLVGREPRLR
jgi:phosphatidylethanolamine/phosphatidyl-N-methylethanolamine N-methyltransferase